MRRLLVCAALSLLCSLPAAEVRAAPKVEFTIKFTPTTGTVGDEFEATVQITIRGVNGPERYWPPNWGDFDVLDSRSQNSTQWSYDPQLGQEIRSVQVHRYLLRPRRAGRITVGEAKLKVDGVEYFTKPQVIEVLDSGKTPTGPGQVQDPGSPGQGSLYPAPDPSIVAPTFLHAFVDKSHARVGEQVTVTWLVYSRTDVLRFEPKALARVADAWIEPLYDPPAYLQWAEDVVQNKSYAVAVISRKAIFPTRAGKLVIPAMRADVATLSTPFGSPLRLASKELTVEVEALPPGAPAGFDPALIGKYEIEAGVDRDNVPAGESIELTLVLRGEGAIRRTKIPQLAVDGFDVYPPRDFQERVESPGDVVRGERRFAYVLTPTRGGSLEVGPIEVPYFNLATGRYDVARADAIKVKVVGDPALVAGVTGSRAENVIGRDIRPPRELAAVHTPLAERFRRSALFWPALLAPGVAFVLLAAGDVLRQRWRRETPRARLRRARGRARRRLRAAEVHIRGNRPAKFFGEISRVLTEHVEDRLGQPVAALTRDELSALLRKKGFKEETVTALATELESCDFARFAPSASGPGEMRAAMRRARDLLAAIERATPGRGGEGDEGEEVAA